MGVETSFLTPGHVDFFVVIKMASVIGALFCVQITCSGDPERYFALFCVILIFWAKSMEIIYFSLSRTMSLSKGVPTAAKSKASPSPEVG